jgi:hypothetical protein
MIVTDYTSIVRMFRRFQVSLLLQFRGERGRCLGGCLKPVHGVLLLNKRLYLTGGSAVVTLMSIGCKRTASRWVVAQYFPNHREAKMKRPGFLLAIIASILLVGFTGPRPSPTAKETIVIEISSTGAGQVEFDVAYMFLSGHSPLKFERHSTPFVLQETSNHVSAIFRKIVGDGQLSVKMSTGTGDKKEVQFSGTGDAAIISTKMGPGKTKPTFNCQTLGLQ